LKRFQLIKPQAPEKKYLREQYTEMVKAKSGSKGGKKGGRKGAKRASPRKVLARITNVGGVGSGLFSFGSPSGKACKYAQSPAMSKDQAKELMVMNYYKAKAKVNEQVRDLQRCMCLKYGTAGAANTPLANTPRTISKPEAQVLLNLRIKLEGLKNEFSAKCQRINFKFDWANVNTGTIQGFVNQDIATSAALDATYGTGRIDALLRVGLTGWVPGGASCFTPEHATAAGLGGGAVAAVNPYAYFGNVGYNAGATEGFNGGGYNGGGYNGGNAGYNGGYNGGMEGFNGGYNGGYNAIANTGYNAGGYNVQ
jgi:hypothetical protein